MAKIKSVITMMGMLERGYVPREMDKHFAQVLETLRDMSDDNLKKTFKGEISLKIGVAMVNGTATVTAQIDSKTPKPEPAQGMFFVDKDGNLNTEHPGQPDMFKPSAVETA